MTASFAYKPVAAAAVAWLATTLAWAQTAASDNVQATPALAQTPPASKKPTAQKTQENPSTSTPQTSTELPAVEVRAQREATSARVWDRQTLDALPQSNRDLTAIVATHPAVRLNPTMGGAANAGSLAPEGFSVHGESPFQNQYLIDGVDATNVIEPHNDNLNLQIGNVPSFAQAYNVDSAVLEQVAVHDSRVPVQFGRFTGGVVDARIKTPTGSNSAGIRYRFNSSGLTQQKIADRLWADAVEGEPGRSAIWQKHFTSAHADMRLTDANALLINVSRRQSDISRVGKVLHPATGGGLTTAANATLEARDQADRVDNLMAKLHTRWSADTSSSLTLKRADRSERLVSNFFPDTAWTHRQRATGAQLHIDHDMAEAGQLHFGVGLDHMDALRSSAATELVTQEFAGLNNATHRYTHGGYGTEALRQRQHNLTLRWSGQPLQMGALRHHFSAGLQWQRTRASFVREQDSSAYRAVRQANGSNRIFNKTLNQAGTVQANVATRTLWVSDRMQATNDWGAWDWTLGLRLDQDNFLGNMNLAPRLRLDWDVGAHEQTHIGLGWARYYGLDLLGHALAEGKSGLRRLVINNQGNPVNQSARITRHNSQGLRTPYSDEWAASIEQHLSPHWAAELAFVHRSSRDAVLQTGTGAAGYRYTNAGSGSAKTATLTLRSLRPIAALGARWTARADVSWQKSRRNHDTTQAYEASEEAPDDLIEFNGQVMPRSHMPPRQFHQPLSASVGATARWDDLGLSWDHRLNWRGSRPAIAYEGVRRGGMQRYASRRLGSHWSWDTAIHWRPAALRGASFGVEILNLTNRQAPIAAQNASASANLRYQTGREIWLSAAFDF